MNTGAFRDTATAKKLVGAINSRAGGLGQVRIMEVCGTHTMEIGRLGLRKLLPENIELISGPGCPVCVTPASYFDALARLALEKNVRIATFGDLFRVPGNRTSLAQARTQGAAVDIVASPLAALAIAEENPAQETVFTAVGFETTAPSTAAAARSAAARGVMNLSFFVAHRLVPPALDALCSDPALNISAFLLPGHVSAIIGEAAYASLVKKKIPGVIAGFEPLDILAGILSILEMLSEGAPSVRNIYPRVVKKEGNAAARTLIDETYAPADAVWRGMGVLPASGLRLRQRYADYDAALKYGLTVDKDEMPRGCSCGEVLKGRCRPDGCALFGKTCTPDHPVGPCMVSSEGSCAAYFKYGW
ncbi:MAG: hydrogenase formation protein HypD [Chitinispirillaceae bacterium]|nr:hydrogenase formation protein HypD [Chitinispirillaceae bacterium]